MRKDYGKGYYYARSDYFSLTGNKDFISVTIKGFRNNKILGHLGSDTLKASGDRNTIEGGAGIDYIYANYTDSGYNQIDGGSGNDKIYSSGSYNKITGGNGNDYIEVTYGNSSNTVIGGAGNDTLIGGKGNDSLWGGNGADTFIYNFGDGKDIIFGFENNDMLQITGAFSASYNKTKKELYFKVGSTAEAITLKNFTATSFNVNGGSYKIIGTSLVRK